MSAHRILFGDVFRQLGWRSPLLIALMALVGLGEGTSVALLLPLLSRIGLVSAHTGGLAIGWLQSGLALVGASSAGAVLGAILAIALVQMALAVGLNWWIARIARQHQSRCQSELFRAIIGAKLSFILDRKSGELTGAIVTEGERLGMAYSITLAIIATLVAIVVYLVLSLLIAWQVTLGVMAFAVVGGLAMGRLYRKSYATGSSIGPLNAALHSILNEQFASAKIIKATNSEARAAAQVDALVGRLERAYTFLSFLPTTVRALLEFAALVGLSVTFVLGSGLLGVAIGNVIVVLALFARLFPRVTSLQAQMHYLNGFVHAIETVRRLQMQAQAEAERHGGADEALRIALPSHLLVQGLDVSLGGRTVLHRIDLSVQMPGMTALVGSSGAGKSTLMHALLGLVEPSAGSIRLGPHALASTPLGAWRRAIGYVPQETLLLHASVRDNIALANPAAAHAEVERAARRAHAHAFITALPRGYDTVIGDQGMKLSGGERQRLGIARALLTSPALLLLDEAMSALDAESERELLATLEHLRQEMAIVLVAHRLLAVRSADCICVIEAGRVVESGTWSELLARRGRFYALAEAQRLLHGEAAVG